MDLPENISLTVIHRFLEDLLSYFTLRYGTPVNDNYIQPGIKYKVTTPTEVKLLFNYKVLNLMIPVANGMNKYQQGIANDIAATIKNMAPGELYNFIYKLAYNYFEMMDFCWKNFRIFLAMMLEIATLIFLENKITVVHDLLISVANFIFYELTQFMQMDAYGGLNGFVDECIRVHTSEYEANHPVEDWYKKKTRRYRKYIVIPSVCKPRLSFIQDAITTNDAVFPLPENDLPENKIVLTFLRAGREEMQSFENEKNILP